MGEQRIMHARVSDLLCLQIPLLSGMTLKRRIKGLKLCVVFISAPLECTLRHGRSSSSTFFVAASGTASPRFGGGGKMDSLFSFFFLFFRVAS